MPSYPERWEADVVLSDGGTMSVRPIRPDDADRIVRFHERQSPESIYFRFFSPRPRLSPRDLERFTNVDYVDRMAFVALLGDELVGVARYDRHRARSDAEVAFFVDDEHHGRGVATVLLEYLAVAAREAGISGFTASVLPQNRKMLGVFTAAGFSAQSHFSDGVIEVELGIEPTPGALAAIEARAASAEARSVERLLKPSSIAVVGASREPGTIGHQVFQQLVSRGFEGPVYPINREATYVASVRAWRSVIDVPGELDLAVICVPVDEVQRVAEECAVKRVQGLVVLSSGFADAGPEGEAAEAQLVAYARRHGMRLIGPNALGIINTDPAVRMHATFVPVDPIPGRIGLVAQSGVIGAAIVDSARQLGLGISSFVAVGNKADVSSNDLLRYWQDDPATDVVMCYLESFGNPAKFSRTARALSQAKPVVAVKVGGAAADHWEEPEGWPSDATGAALLEQTGIVRVDNLTQMFHTAGVLAHQPLPAGRRVAVVTNSWGPAWLANDALRASGLEPTDPIDLSNEAEPERFTTALAAAYARPDVDAVLVIYAPALVGRYREVAAAVRAAAAAPGAVTTVACLLGEHRSGLLVDEHVRVPEFPFPEEAALALGRLAGYADWRAQPVGEAWELPLAARATARALVADWLADSVGRAPAEPPPSGSADGPTNVADSGSGAGDADGPTTVAPTDSGLGSRDPDGSPKVAPTDSGSGSGGADGVGGADDVAPPDEADRRRRALAARRRTLGPTEAAELLACAGIAGVPQMLVGDLDAAVAGARSIGYPVALKASGLERLSKTESGGVSLDVHGDDEVADAYRRMIDLLGDAMRPALVQAMVPEGVECRVGVFRHAVLGDVLTLGPGGAIAERVAGEAMRILPLTDADAERLIDASVVAPLLAEHGPEARAALVDLLGRLAALAEAIPEITAVRLNPVLVSGTSAHVTDARITLAPHTPDLRPTVRRL